MEVEDWWNGLSVDERKKWLKERRLNLENATKLFEEQSSHFQEVLIISRAAEM